MMAKSRVAPLKQCTIPRLELCGALTVSKMLEFVTKEMQIPLEQTFAWTDSSIVLAWLNASGNKLGTFERHRVDDIHSRIPAKLWRHVPTSINPADLVSRGVSPRELLALELWWKGPPRLQQSPEYWPQSPDLNPVRELPDVEQTVLTVQHTEDEFGSDFSSMG